ncbi:Bro-N domain-containing protein [Candidatus Saccharibacteria bacterium]|nr:Bro-N domain-containing protein [Candidatus Saccharibacteria bacterium]
MTDEIIKIAIFQKKEIRKQLHGNEWWFVINDVVSVLADTSKPQGYLRNLRRRDAELANLYEAVDKGGGQIDPPLGLYFDTSGGRQILLCWNTEGIFRLIQSIPSKKAEPFKRWLARTGYERVQEIENPELAQKRMKAIYKAKGYPDDWIERRVRGIAIRHELTDEWEKRGVSKGQDFAVLTAEISRATFGITPSEYKKLKGLKRENLRDHMNDLELLFSQLGEASTAEIARTDNAQGMQENKDVARRGGAVAGTARKQLESETSKKVVNSDNFLSESVSALKSKPLPKPKKT